MYTVSFVGLNYFNACRVGNHCDALIPNGTPGSGKEEAQLPQHFASLFIEEDRWDSDNWWPDQKYVRAIQLEIKLGEFRTVNVIEFRIPPKPRPETYPVELRFSCNEGPGTLSNLNLDEGLPKLQPMGFVLDDQPDAIAKVPLPGGDLEVFRFGGSTLVRWLIEHHDDPITITASDEKGRRSVRLKKSDGSLPAEIVFSNTIELLPHAGNGGNGHPSVQSTGMSGGGMAGMGTVMSAMAGAAVNGGMGGMHHHGPAGHFVLFAKLDETRNERKLDKTVFPNPMNLRPAIFSHPYLAYLSSMQETPDPQCSGSCC